MTISQQNTVRRLKVFGLSTTSSVQIVQEVNRLLSQNGPEWTISRIKALKTAFIHMVSGQDPEWTWIKSRSGLPVGPFRAIFNLKKPHKVLNCLMVYSSLISPKVTEKQWKKFHDSVTKVRQNPIDLFKDIYSPFSRSHNRELKYNDSRLSRLLLSTVRSPSIHKGKMKTGQLSSKDRLRSANHSLARSFLISLHKEDSNTGFPEWIYNTIKENWRHVSSVHDLLDSKGVVGRISFLQEPGFKLRAIANPLPIFQILLDPLKDALLETLRLIPNDFTHDQDEGVAYIQNLLKQGYNLSSVDLSDATNHLPLTDQLHLLYALFGNECKDVGLFADVARSGWIVDSPDGETILKWTTGQPLGLGPSFPSFALYHHFIMRYVISQVEGDLEPLHLLMQGIFDRAFCGDFKYAIVGDDIVMDSRYTDTYISTIEKLGCKISMEKCIFNAPSAEFCSRIITKDKIYRAYKWKSVNDSSFISICKAFGPKILPLLRPRQQYIAKRIGSIPDTLGGPIGWNPDGKCLLQREAELWRLAEELNSLKTDEDLSVPKAEVHYQLKKELGLIPFPRTSVANLIHQRSNTSLVEAEDHRQMFVQELMWQLHNGASSKVAVTCAQYFSGIHITESMMTELERNLNNFVMKQSSKDLDGGDLFVRKLYSMLKENHSL
jgi:hypothetical protein